MRFSTSIFLLFATLTAAVGETTAPLHEPGASGTSPREVALDNLLSERESAKALDKVIAAAKKNGVSEQAILEARFLYHVDRREDDAIAAMLPEVLKQGETFKLENSAIFSVKEDWLAVTEYVQAIAALKKGDKDAFKSHITEAFWLSPRQASAFAPHIDRMRLEETMRRVKIDFESKFLPLEGDETVSLKKIMAGKKALVLQFWSPASRECEASLPDFAITAKALGEKEIAIISLIPGDSPELLAKARAMVHPAGSTTVGTWLVDQKENPLARELRVQGLPAFVLISNEGRILFNGDPTDDGLWDALKKIDPKITRPEITGPSE